MDAKYWFNCRKGLALACTPFGVIFALVVFVMVGKKSGYAQLAQAVNPACFIFVNKSSVVDAPIFDASGNPLEGMNYLAALYVGSLPGNLRPSPRAAPQPFRTGTAAGYLTTTIVDFPDLEAGFDYWVQV